MIRRGTYTFIYYKYWDFSILDLVMDIMKRKIKVNDIIIMADTETSKEVPGQVCRNYVVAWTISLRSFDTNIVTLYGHKPSEFIDAVNRIIMAMKGDQTYIYFHNLPYDWQFLRKFMFREWGYPLHQLNVKPHYPIYIEFENGIILRDSLILAQRGLDSWASELQVRHQKACGFWDYDVIRHQNGRFTPHEKTYIEHDTLAGVECLQATLDTLHKDIAHIPFTATGIPRENVQRLAKANDGRELFLKIVPSYDIQLILENVFHGGYTHNNRRYIEVITKGDITAYDAASQYPHCLCRFKFPMGKFTPLHKPQSIEFILENAEKYAFIFKLILIKPKLKNNSIPMPVIQKSKGTKMINAVDDNGRILCSEYFELYTNEIDLSLIAAQYDYHAAACVEVYYSEKDYLPRWFTDYVYECFVEKTNLKGGDPVDYAIAKAKLNSLYGMCVQHPVKLIIEENYISGEYGIPEDQNPRKLYDDYINNMNSVLPYQWGVWTTSYAMKCLFEIGSNCQGIGSDGKEGIWLYSDTDSCYGIHWNHEGIKEYNRKCMEDLTVRGYGSVHHNGRDYWLGICEVDGEYSEFISLGAKRYAVRKKKDGLLKITVAGVPKKGFLCLDNDLHNFHAGFIFDGETTGKKQHSYFNEEEIWIDEYGNERGDSIDLSPVSYLLDSVTEMDWEKIFYDEIEVVIYDENLLRHPG